MKITDLQAQRSHLLLRNEDITNAAKKDGERQLKPEERQEIFQNLEDARKIETQIEEVRQNEEILKRQSQAMNSYREEGRSTPGITPTNGDVPTGIRPDIEIPRCGELRCFKGPNAHRNAYRSGQWFLAKFLGLPSAERYCREHGLLEETRAHIEGTGSLGGFLVPDELAATIINNTEKYGVTRRAMRPYPMKSETAGIPRKKGTLQAYFTAEAQAIQESTTEWDKVNLVAKKLSAYTRYSKELDADAIVNIVDILVDEIAQAFAYKEDLCAFVGDGSDTYGGITGIVTLLEAATTFAGYVDAATGHDTYAEIDIADINKLMGMLPEYAEPNAAFYCSKLFREMVFGRMLVTSGGNSKSDVSGPVQYTFMGFPVLTSPVLHRTPDTTNNQVICLFGDLQKAATLGQRTSIELGISEHQHWTTDEIALKASERFDFNVHSIGNTTDAGPVVALVGKTA